MPSVTVDWSKNLDTEVNVSGVAQNAKAGALLMTGREDAILIQGLSEWDPKVVGKTITVQAIVRRVPGYPKAKVFEGLSTQGTATGGDIWVLEMKYYHVLK